MIRESRYTAILQAAQNKDPSICGGFKNKEEEDSYNANVKWFDKLRKEFGDDLSGIQIDIPYSYDDDDDEDEEDPDKEFFE